ncbi:MAG: alpha/beta hydrolase [Nitrospinae bacterium]|nr:alpha/beta hydrolase [Nitrospinota bacterium]
MTTSEKVWKIPKPLSVHELCMEDGTVIFLRRHGNPAGPRLVLCHGNGLAIDLYYPFWSLLAEDFDLFLYDLRNHGWNPVGSQREHNIPSFVDDHDRILEEIDNHYGKKPKTGVFHSVSALTSLLSPTQGSGFAARILFDPPVCKPNDYPEEYDMATRRCTEMILRRADRFHSMEECVDFLRYVPYFFRVVPGVRELYARTTLRESGNGEGYELRCPRDYEAQIVNHARTYAVWVDLEALHCPTKVIGADPVLPYSFLPTFNLSRISSVDYDFLPEATHFLQIEQPEKCVAMIREFMEHHDLLNP